jgi:hypothetical protein
VFRNRTFLLGLGIGLAMGAVLLQLMLVGRAATDQTEQIDQMNGEDALYTQQELDERIADAEAKIRAELQAEDEADDSGNDSAAKTADKTVLGEDEPKAKPDERQAAEPAAKPESVVVEKLPVRIKPGMKLGEVVELLHSKGIIKDERVFLVLMSDLSTEIEAGFYFFDGELSPADVKRILMSPPFAY